MRTHKAGSTAESITMQGIVFYDAFSVTSGEVRASGKGRRPRFMSEERSSENSHAQPLRIRSWYDCVPTARSVDIKFLLPRKGALE